MTSLLPAQVEIMAAARAPRRSLLMLIVGDGFTLRYWGGVGFLALDAADDLDPSGRYTGAGIMNDLPPIRQITGGKAERVDITVAATNTVVSSQVTNVRDCLLYIGYVFFNDDWQIVGPAAWLWQGAIDVIRRDSSAESRTWTISAVSGAATRGKAGRRYWSNAGHQSRHPGDDFWDRVQLMTINRNLSLG